jgi:hypothetical protein
MYGWSIQNQPKPKKTKEERRKNIKNSHFSPFLLIFADFCTFECRLLTCIYDPLLEFEGNGQ